MKKTKAILVAVCLLATAMMLVPSTVAHSEDDPMTRTLYAGQDIPVGQVEIWNDEKYIYVDYIITDEDWEITATHLYVGITNPNTLTTAPGQFPYTGKISYKIALSAIDSYHMVKGKMVADETPGVDKDDCVYIAAHADVKKETIDSDYMEFVSDTTTQVLDGSAHVDGSTWSNAVACWAHPAWANIAGATWIWRTVNTDSAWEYANVPEYNTLNHLYGWLFKKTFSLPSSAFNIGGNIAINSDNAFDAYLNGASLCGEGAMQLNGPDTHDYASVVSYGFVPNAGLNTLTIRALNYFNWGSSTGNPAGLAFKAEIWYDYISCVQKESAWACGTDFEQPNWAMYFQYCIQGWEPLGHVHVPANGASATVSSIDFEDGVHYKLKATGTAFAGDNIEFDAKYSFRTGSSTTWTDAVSTYESYGIHLLDLKVNGNYVNWGSYSSTHNYNYYMDGTGTPLTFEFQIYDVYYPNNSGELIVYIYEWA